MDPNATVEAMLDEVKHGDLHTACLHARNLLAWLDKGGFMPEALKPETIESFRGYYRCLMRMALYAK